MPELEITDVNTLFGAYPSQQPDSTSKSLSAVLDREGVHWCLTLSTYGIFYSAPEGDHETMRACRSQERLIPVATVNPTHYIGEEDAIDSILVDAFEMFRFFPHAQSWPLDYQPFLDVIGKLAQSPKMPVMVSIRQRGDITTLSRLLGRYPHPVIMEGVSADTLVEAISVMRRSQLFYLETHALNTPGAFDLLRDQVGTERILFGSNAPGLSLAAALRAVRHSSLSETAQAAILGTNAQRIWQS